MNAPQTCLIKSELQMLPALTCVHADRALTTTEEWTQAIVVNGLVDVQRRHRLCAAVEHHIWYHGLSAGGDGTAALCCPASLDGGEWGLCKREGATRNDIIIICLFSN